MLKTLVILMCVAVVVEMQNAAYLRLFDNLANELGMRLKLKFHHDYQVTQMECLNQCKLELSLGQEMCKDICIEAGKQFSHVVEATQSP